jgi:hypothetical protein
MITNQQLRETFLSPAMQYYLHKKLAPLEPEEIDIRTEELLKYLNMSVYCNGDIPFNRDIDDVWHFWIMETREYFDLCNKLHGKGYIHHSSNDYQEYFNQDVKDKKPDFDRVIHILVSYVLNYGPFDERRVRYWPLAERLMNSMQWNAEQLNAWLFNILDERAVVHA